MVLQEVDAQRAAFDADDMVRSAKQALEEIAENDAINQDDVGAIKKLTKHVENYEAKQRPVAKAVRGEGGRMKKNPLTPEEMYDAAADRYMALDNIKREVGRVVDNAKNRGSLTVDKLRGVAESFADHLENPDTWGADAANLQRVRNRAWRDRLLLESGRESPARLFMNQGSGASAADPYRIARQPDLAKIKAAARNAGKLENSTQDEMLRMYAERQATLNKALVAGAEDQPINALASGADASKQQIIDTLARRVAANKAAADMQGAMAVKPEPSALRQFGTAVVEAMPGVTKLEQTFPRLAQKTLGTRAAELSQLEAAYAENPLNVLAQRKLHAAGVPGIPAPPPRVSVQVAETAQRANPVAATMREPRAFAAPQMQSAPAYMAPEDEQQQQAAAVSPQAADASTTGATRGHELLPALEELARSNPAALGKQAQAFAEALRKHDAGDTGALAATVAVAAQTDPDFQTLIAQLGAE
jgi:hypothetical protein